MFLQKDKTHLPLSSGNCAMKHSIVHAFFFFLSFWESDKRIMKFHCSNQR